MEKLVQELSWESKIDDGCDGVVYRIPETNHVVKILHFRNEDSLRNEYEISCELFGNKIQVPRPFGLNRFLVQNHKYPSDISKLGFIMEYIRGIRLDRISNSKVRDTITKIRDKELDKVEALGFRTRDSEGQVNAIWCPSRKKVYLIDFIGWRKRSKS